MGRINVKNRAKKELLELSKELERCEYGVIVEEEEWVRRERMNLSGNFLGFRLISKNHNQLWMWKTLESA